MEKLGIFFVLCCIMPNSFLFYGKENPKSMPTLLENCLFWMHAPSPFYQFCIISHHTNQTQNKEIKHFVNEKPHLLTLTNFHATLMMQVQTYEVTL